MLSRLSIASRLGLLILPFVLVIAGLAGVLSLEKWHSLSRLQASAQLLQVAGKASNLIHQLQAERGLSNGFLAAAGSSVPDELKSARQQTDSALSDFHRSLAQLPDATQAAAVDGQVAALLQGRAAIDSRSQPAGQMFAAYSDNIEALIGLIAGLAGSTSDAGLLQDTVALVNLQCQKEFAGRERGFINGVLGRGSFDQASLLQAAGLQAKQQACASQLRLVASSSLRALSQRADQSAEAAAVQAMRQQIMTTPLGQPLGVASAQWFKTATAQMANLKQLQDVLLEQLDQHVQRLLGEAGFQLWFTLLGSAATILVLSLLGWAIYHSVERPISRLEQLMGGMSRDFDLSRRAALPGSDEIARMGHAFDHLVDAFADTLRQIKTEAHQMMAAARSLNDVSARAASTADVQSRSSVDIAAAIEQMSAGIAAVTDNAEQAMRVAQDMQTCVDDGRARMRSTATALSETADGLTQTGDSVDMLRDKSEGIHSIVTAIREIADQTNLLALNAAIEAARAGEMGRGFAVVADEVRKLAERTSKETLDIAALIEDIRRETRGVAQQMATARQRMQGGMAEVDLTVADLALIHDKASDTAGKSRSTTLAMQEQTAASNDVATNVSKIAALAENNAHIVQEAAALSGQLNSTAGKMVELVDRFQHSSH
ncbi:methyl-accepting chemotaxis protein [Aquitalea magnusonii]|uniref:Methyl-accepting chemotaxis protein n=1 Tax=Aquitalea magnusonii TaxID=332411 RepID=A0A3G9GHL6_9NEIS|nr:methyl-accepting chemotaxis protein [Aquitalea magnusonii]BBF86333.1 methyl-accepting chemotaxis protein [Aquitalea magnusonii]